MSDLRQAAQAVVDRWDSPLWKNGSTADAIADLRAALEEAEQRRAEFSEATQRNKDHAEWYLKTHPQQAESDRQALQAAGTHPAPCARHCEAKAFEIEIRSLESRLKQQADPVTCGYDETTGNCTRELCCRATQQAEPVAHAVVAGALFDFMGWLTTRKERLVLSSTDNASPAADAIKDFAEMRGLSLDDARVQDWQTYTTPSHQQAEPVCPDCKAAVLYECVACSSNNYPPQQQAEPVAWGVDWGHNGDRSCVSIIKKHHDGTIEVIATECDPKASTPPQRKPLTDEQDRALCEAYCNDASDKYFKARPALDFPEMRRIFYAGHRKAWISYEAAHGIKGEV